MSLKDAIKTKKQQHNVNKQRALKEVTKEPVKRLNVNIPESRLKQFKIKAITEGTDMSTLINQWINNYLK